MSNRNKVTHYKVWIHIEGLNETGDVVEGDEYFESNEVGCVDTLTEAEDLRELILEYCERLLEGADGPQTVRT